MRSTKAMHDPCMTKQRRRVAKFCINLCSGTDCSRPQQGAHRALGGPAACLGRRRRPSPQGWRWLTTPRCGDTSGSGTARPARRIPTRLSSCIACMPEVSPPQPWQVVTNIHARPGMQRLHTLASVGSARHGGVRACKGPRSHSGRHVGASIKQSDCRLADSWERWRTSTAGASSGEGRSAGATAPASAHWRPSASMRWRRSASVLASSGQPASPHLPAPRAARWLPSRDPSKRATRVREPLHSCPAPHAQPARWQPTLHKYGYVPLPAARACPFFTFYVGVHKRSPAGRADACVDVLRSQRRRARAHVERPAEALVGPRARVHADERLCGRARGQPLALHQVRRNHLRRDRMSARVELDTGGCWAGAARAARAVALRDTPAAQCTRTRPPPCSAPRTNAMAAGRCCRMSCALAGRAVTGPRPGGRRGAPSQAAGAARTAEGVSGSHTSSFVKVPCC